VANTWFLLLPKRRVAEEEEALTVTSRCCSCTVEQNDTKCNVKDFFEKLINTLCASRKNTKLSEKFTHSCFLNG